MTRRKPPPRPLVWTSQCGRYTLRLLCDPQHLIDEGKAMKHCIGSLYPRWLFLNAEVKGCALGPHELTYWRRVRKGLATLFSFTQDGQPLVTIEIADGPPPILSDVRMKHNHRINGSERFYPVLQDALMSVVPFFPGLQIDLLKFRPLPHANYDRAVPESRFSAEDLLDVATPAIRRRKKRPKPPRTLMH